MPLPKHLLERPLGWETMWVFAMFDLPMVKKIQRKRYTQFRNALLKDGFAKMQYSVYYRHCASMENVEVHMQRMGDLVPPEGEVRFMVLTDHQFGKMRTYLGKKKKEPEKAPAQLEFF